MCRFLFCFCLTLICLATKAQTTDSVKTVDVVITTSGQTYFGKVTIDTANKYVVIQATDSNTYKFPFGFVSKIKRNHRIDEGDTPVARVYKSKVDLPDKLDLNAPIPDSVRYFWQYSTMIPKDVLKKRRIGMALTVVGSAAMFVGASLLTAGLLQGNNVHTYSYGSQAGVVFHGTAGTGVIVVILSVPILAVGISKLAKTNRWRNANSRN